MPWIEHVKGGARYAFPIMVDPTNADTNEEAIKMRKFHAKERDFCLANSKGCSFFKEEAKYHLQWFNAYDKVVKYYNLPASELGVTKDTAPLVDLAGLKCTININTKETSL